MTVQSYVFEAYNGIEIGLKSNKRFCVNGSVMKRPEDIKPNDVVCYLDAGGPEAKIKQLLRVENV